MYRANISKLKKGLDEEDENSKKECQTRGKEERKETVAWVKKCVYTVYNM